MAVTFTSHVNVMYEKNTIFQNGKLTTLCQSQPALVKPCDVSVAVLNCFEVLPVVFTCNQTTK